MSKIENVAYVIALTDAVITAAGAGYTRGDVDDMAALSRIVGGLLDRDHPGRHQAHESWGGLSWSDLKARETPR